MQYRMCVFLSEPFFSSTYRNEKLTRINDVDLLKNFYKNVSALSVHYQTVYLYGTYTM